MRRITISVLSVLIAMPAVASARLPVVDIASGGVSARAAFGATDNNVASVGAKKVAPTRAKKVVARNAAKTAVAPVDTGEKIVASTADVLAPRRPSADLWAKNDTALRMPNVSEFSVIRTDSLLPEERIDQTVSIVSNKPAAESAVDNQIARLNALQKRAQDSVRNVSSRVIAAPIAQSADVAPVALADATDESQNVSLRRMVVEMKNEPDVITRKVEKNTSSRIASAREDMVNMSPTQLRQAFRKTFLSENKHLSAYPIDDTFDVASDMSSSIEGFTARRDLSEEGGIRPLEIKINFRNEDSALSRANYTLLTEYAGIVVSKPTRAIQVAIPQFMTTDADARKLAARRLAIVEQVLTDNGVSKQRIVPVLSSRDESGFVLRVISRDQYDTLTQQKRDIFGDAIGKKTYKSMSW